MRVKLFLSNITDAINPSSKYVSGKHLETKINAWLENSPQAEVRFVQHALSPINSNTLVSSVLVWYDEV